MFDLMSEDIRMARKNTASKIDDLAAKIMEHKKLYYAGQPEVEDVVYDGWEDELRRLRPTHPVLNMVGHEINSDGKVAHEIPMLSLQKVYKLEDLMSWIDGRSVVGTYKLDGNSLALVYNKGKLTTVKTRGNGRFGEDVTEKGLWITDVVHTIKDSVSVEIRGELYCNESRFLELSDVMASLGLDRPTNPRNIVAGILGRKSHVDLARFFNFEAFDVVELDSSIALETEMDKFKWIESQGLRIPSARLLQEGEQVETWLDEVLQAMQSGSIGLDGAVLTYNDLALHRELGSTSHHPRYKMSFKWQGETAESTIKDITWATSRLGIVTPVAVIEPVELSGAKIVNVTLHNALHVKKENLMPGDRIELVRSGEVIPKFLRVTLRSKEGKSILPSHCPSCGSELVFDEVRLVCESKSCSAQQMGALLNWIKCAEIEDLSEKRLESMIDLGLVNKISDFYALNIESMLTLPLTKDKMAQKLISNIDKSRSLPLSRFLAGIGIGGMGMTSWEKLLEIFPSLPEVRSASIEQVQNVDGFAEKTAMGVVNGLKQKSDLIDDLIRVGVMPVAPSAAEIDAQVTGRENSFSGLQIVITGKLSQPRAALEKRIKKVGGKTGSAVSKNTSFLVCNDKQSNSSKMKKARELNIPVWSEDDLIEKLEEISTGG